MTDKSHPSALLLLKDMAKASRMENLLTNAGWTVVLEKEPQSALKRLADTARQPFGLFICSYVFAADTDTPVFETAKSLSPLTQRMLMVPMDQPDLLISAINNSDIEACITKSFKDTELLDQARTCLIQFQAQIKERQMKRVVGHQNKKMRQIAGKLKQKDKTLLRRINEKKAERLMLRSRLRQGEKKENQLCPHTLMARLEANGYDLSLASLETQFAKLAAWIQRLFDEVSRENGLSPVSRADGSFTASPHWDDLIASILHTAYLSPDAPHPLPELPEQEPVDSSECIENVVEISISEDRVHAFIRKTCEPRQPETLTLASLLSGLKDYGVTYGVVEDKVLQGWIETAGPGDEKMIAALGDPPQNGRDGSVAHCFKIDYTNPGKILEDGTIDFRQRGEIPYVYEGDLLAQKEPAVPGKPGINVRGEEIPYTEALDPLFAAGDGARISGDGLKIFAAQKGQPHVDVMGTVTVNTELTIKGNVDFETGNIDFNGNIRVLGTIKNGFSVKGIHLTANEIEGAVIDVKGDVSVSGGITDTQITAQGNVYAKFLNNTSVRTFGDVIVQKEIIDSKVAASGAFICTHGRVTASSISAKSGVEARRIGTEASTPSVLTVGRDDHADRLFNTIDAALEESVAQLKTLRERIKELEDKDQALYGSITLKAQVQETAQNALNSFKEKVAARQTGLTRQKVLDRLRHLTDRARQAGEDLDKTFETQDAYAGEIETLKTDIEGLEQANKRKVLEKKAIRGFSQRKEPRARVIVHGLVTQGTKICGPNTSLTLQRDEPRCRILERAVNEDGLFFHEITITESAET